MITGNVEKVRIELNLFSKNFGKKIKVAQNQFEKFNKQINAQSHAVSKINKRGKIMSNNLRQGGIAQQGFFKTMRMGQPQLKTFNEQGRKFTTIGGRMANRFRMITHGMRGFRMEALGVMFFGMMMQRMFMGLLQPVMEAFGVFDLFRIMLLVLFLPVMEMMFPILLEIMERFMGLSESTKKTIGIIVLLGFVFGTVLMLLGQFALGIGSLILFFGVLASPILLIVGALTAIAGFIFLKDFFKDIGSSIDKARTPLIAFGLSGEVFDTMKNKIISWWEILKEKFSGLKQNIGTWIGEALPIVIIGGGDLIMKLIDGISNNSSKVGKAIKTLIEKISTWISENSSVIIDGGLEILQFLIDGIMDNLDKLIKVIEELAAKLTQFVLQNIDDFIEIGVKIGAAIGKGIGKSIMSWFDKIDDWIEEKTGIQTRLKGNYSSTKNENDLIWRSEQGSVSAGSNNTSMSRRDIPEFLGGGGSSNITNNFYGFTMDELKRELDDRDRKVTEDIRRIVKT